MSSAQLKSMRKELEEVLAQARLMAFVQVVRRHDSATLGDVMVLAKEMDLEGVNIGGLFSSDMPMTGRGWESKQRSLVGHGSSGGIPNVRTVEGRRLFDKRILDILCRRRDWCGASDIREISGGNPGQVRVSLNRLIGSGKVEYKGHARSTMYKAV